MPGLMIPPRWSCDPAQAGKVAVLVGDELYTFTNEPPRDNAKWPWPLVFDGGMERVKSAVTFCGLLIGLLADGVETLMVTPMLGNRFDSQFDHEMVRDWPRCALPEALEYESAGELKVHPLSSRSFGLSSLGGVVAQFAQGGPLLCVYGPDALEGWGLLDDGLPSITWFRARVLASAWLHASYALGQRLRFSASYSGLALMRQQLASQEKRLNLEPPDEDYRALIRGAQAHPLSWARPYVRPAPANPLEADAETVPVWAYDRNFSWITSAREVPVGNPEPVHEVIVNTPGVYFVSMTPPADALQDLALEPGPICENGRWVHETRGAWAWEPTLRYALAHGYHVEVITGYAWPRSQRVDLRSWNDRVWAARRELASLSQAREFLAGDVGRLGERLVKAAARAALGRLNQVRGYAMASLTTIDPEDARHLDIGDHGELTGYGEVEAPLGRSDLVRPEWWSTFVSQANERLLTVAHLYAPTHQVVCAYFDGVYLLREAPELDGPPLKAGGWHLEHAVRVSAAALRTGNAGRIVRACNEADALPTIASERTVRG